MYKLNNIIPFTGGNSSSKHLVSDLNKNFNIQLNISLTNIACIESSSPNRLLKTAIDLHRQMDGIGFLQMTESNQKLFNSIKKIKELESMSLFFPEISDISPRLQEELFLFIKNNPATHLFFIFGSTIPFSELKKKFLIVKEFQVLAKKVIQLDNSLIKILDISTS
ncbi:MAG: hypothetical protein HAW60_04295 [Bdellovibrionales bacterium]|nr:hypothetical protein [Bdellovibrionales bacterium]